MTAQKDEQIKIEITQDKLVDILMHSATREDIAKLDDKIENKIDSVITEFKRSNEVMEARILAEFRNAITDLNNRSGREFQKIDHRYNWIIATIVGCSIGLAGLIFKLH